jgi:hypothetical protein
MVTYNRFSPKGAYNCAICKKLTRDTGHGEADIDTGYCKKCMYECYMENAANDYGEDSQEYKDAQANYKACE